VFYVVGITHGKREYMISLNQVIHKIDISKNHRGPAMTTFYKGDELICP